MNQESKFWKNCSSCKKEIGFSTPYYGCSVSTCKHPRTGLVFCSVPCWDAHLGFANHRESWAEELKSPLRSSFETEFKGENDRTPARPPVRKIINSTPSTSSPSNLSSSSGTINDYTKAAQNISTDTLIVVSKVKQLISNQSGFNTSQCCVDALTKKVIEECLKAIENAKQAGRKTVMGRDVG